MIVIALGVSACGLFPGGREDKETMKSVTEAEAVLESLTFQFLDNAKGPRETSAGSADDAEESPFVICIRRRAEKGAAELSLRDPKHLAGEDVKPSLMLGEDFLDKIAALIREGGLQEARQRGDREMPAGSKRATCLTTQFRGKDVATVRSSDRMTPAEEDAYYKVFNALMRAFRLGEDPFLAEEPGAPGSWLLESVSCERFGVSVRAARSSKPSVRRTAMRCFCRSKKAESSIPDLPENYRGIRPTSVFWTRSSPLFWTRGFMKPGSARGTGS